MPPEIDRQVYGENFTDGTERGRYGKAAKQWSRGNRENWGNDGFGHSELEVSEQLLWVPGICPVSTHDNYISQFPQDFGMHLIPSHRLMYIRVPQVVTNLIFTYNGRDFVAPVPILLSIHLRDHKLFHSVEDFLKDLPAQFHSPVPKGSFSEDPIDYLLEQPEVCFAEAQGLILLLT
ncbi:hypothetical protein HGM15179_019411 [Zosterops borbonicus]|uniref:Uncharacterized protein n=1 Tax=Zosterops borbonicus TaxID=364589 RepID=A0A8K1D882_9PASS|nr:hypothetical protein HGM15179_019411 [Zosterops borbonicus]